MKNFLYTLAATLLLLATFSQASAQNLKTQTDSIAYALGQSLGEATVKDGIKLDHKLIRKSFDASMEGTSSMTDEDFRGLMKSLQNELVSRERKPFTKTDQPKINLDSVALGLGYSIATNFKRSGMELSGKLLGKGYRDGLDSKKTRLDSATVQQLMVRMQALQQEGLAEQQRIESEKNQEEAEAFLEENKLKEGVVETESGLQYKVEREGSGDSPTESDRVEVHYKGYLINGEVFDSSYERGEPATFPLNAVIKGWTEGLQLMKPGGKNVFYIPAELGYGARGQGGTIGPNALLIFEVELLEVKK